MRRGILGLILFVLVSLVAGGIGYQAGLTANAAGAGATVIVTGGLPGFGTLLFLVFCGWLLFASAGRRRGWGPGHGHGPWAGRMGPGGFGGPGSSAGGTDPRRQWIADLHRRLHEEETAASRPAGGTPAG